VIVIEAASTGGALITAKFGFEQDRQIYAIPGPLDHSFSEGCNALIRDNIAKLVTKPEEILSDLDLSLEPRKTSAHPKEQPVLSAEERKIAKALSKSPMHADLIGLETNVSQGKLMSFLLAMEIKGVIKQLPGKRFALV
jgi:DNA processing protein